MSYAVKEIYFTLQGEGAQTGRAAVFLRFAGCNLWSGREEDRAGAVCTFCDTDFVGVDGPGGARFKDAARLAAAVAALWPGRAPVFSDGVSPSSGASRHLLPAGRRTFSPRGEAPHSDARARVRPFVVCTGGEPLLQLDTSLIAALHAEGFEIGVETNGTIAAPAGLDWICVSPKADAPLAQRSGHELKLVYPQPGVDPARFAALPFAHFFLQPMDGPARDENTRAALAYCRAHPQWRLSIQTHKLLGFP